MAVTMSVTANKTATTNAGSTNFVGIHGVTEGSPDFNLNYKSVTASRVGTSIQIDIKGLCLYLRYGSSATFFGYYYGVWPEVTYGVAGDESTHKLIQAHRKELITSGDRKDSYYIHAENAVIFKPISGYSWSDSTNSNKTGFCPKDNTTWDATITVSGVPNNTNFVNIAFRGDSFTGYIYSNTKDANGTTMAAGTYMGGCPCASHEGNIGNASIEVFWTGISGGSVSARDNNYNQLQITGTNFTKGTNNDIKSSNLQITFKDSANNSLNTATAKTPYIVSVGTTSKATFSKSVKITDVVATTDLSKVAKATVKLVGEGNRGDTLEKSTTPANTSIVYHTPPKAPSKMWINTGKITDYPDNIKSSYKKDATSSQTENDALKPRTKELLMWKWSGYAAGTNSDIAGFRVFIYKNSTACTKGSSVQISKPYGINTTKNGDGSITETLVEIGSAVTGSNDLGYYCDIGVDLVNENNTQFGFIPINESFSSKDTCTCKVYTYSYWGSDSTTKHFSDNDFNSTLDFIIGTCTLFNSAVVWVRVDTDGDGTPDTWKEGTVYVYHDSEWKEAEGVYVRNGGKWKEST